MRKTILLGLLLCSLFASAQPALQDTTRFLVFDPVKSWVTTCSALRTYTIGNGFTAFTGPTTSLKTFTLPNASATILTTNALVSVAQGGTGVSSITGLLQGNGTGTFTGITNSSTAGQVLRVTGASTYAWGPVDLTDADAVSGVLPAANGGNETTTGRATGQTAANSSVVTLTVGGSDASYEVSANVLTTVSNSEIFTVNVDYTDEGNTARSLQLPLANINGGGTYTTNVRFANGTVPYSSPVQQIRCKASTSITIKTTGTFTGCTYNVEGRITKI